MDEPAVDLLPRRAVVPEAVIAQRVEGEMVLLQLDEGQYYGLDAVGTRMWQLLTSEASLDAACDRLLEEYEAEPAQLRRDLLRLVAELVENGLLELSD